MARLTDLARHATLHPWRIFVAPAVRIAPLEQRGGPPESGRATGTREATIRVGGMVCGVCAARTRSALAGVPGVEEVEVDLGRGTATLRLAEGAPADADALQQALDRVVVGRRARVRLEALMGAVNSIGLRVAAVTTAASARLVAWSTRFVPPISGSSDLPAREDSNRG